MRFQRRALLRWRWVRTMYPSVTKIPHDEKHHQNVATKGRFKYYVRDRGTPLFVPPNFVPPQFVPSNSSQNNSSHGTHRPSPIRPSINGPMVQTVPGWMAPDGAFCERLIVLSLTRIVFYLEELLPIFTTAIKFAHTETIASASSGVQAVRIFASGTRSSGIDDCTDLCRPVSSKEAKEVQIANWKIVGSSQALRWYWYCWFSSWHVCELGD